MIDEHAMRIKAAAVALEKALEDAEADGYKVEDYANGLGRDFRYDLVLTVE